MAGYSGQVGTAVCNRHGQGMLPVAGCARQRNPVARRLIPSMPGLVDAGVVRGREGSAARERLFIGVGWLRLPANWGGPYANAKDIFGIGGGGGSLWCRWTRQPSERSRRYRHGREHERRREEQRRLGCGAGSE